MFSTHQHSLQALEHLWHFVGDKSLTECAQIAGHPRAHFLLDELDQLLLCVVLGNVGADHRDGHLTLFAARGGLHDVDLLLKRWRSKERNRGIVEENEEEEKTYQEGRQAVNF